ncbi:PRC-barrel domain-containing protein [Propionibacteriaceae bacterium Y1923]
MTEINLDDYYDAVVFDSNGEKVGGVGQVFLDEETGSPSWVTVRTGLFGLKESFIPLVDHRLEDGVLHVDFTKEFIKDAPRQDPEAPMTVAEEDALQAYYGTEDEPEKIQAAYQERMAEAGRGAAPADQEEFQREHAEDEVVSEKDEADLLEDAQQEDSVLADDDRPVDLDDEH